MDRSLGHFSGQTEFTVCLVPCTPSFVVAGIVLFLLDDPHGRILCRCNGCCRVSSANNPARFSSSCVYLPFSGDMVGNDGLVGIYFDCGNRVRNQSWEGRMG